MKRIRRKFIPPTHPWQSSRIEKEKEYIKNYGFKRKSEIWRAESLLRKSKSQAKKLTALKTKQSELETKQLINRLVSLGLINENAKLEDILALTSEKLFERRLQTQVLRKALAKTITQSRQFIVHGHILVNNKKVTIPSYLVLKNEEDKIQFSPKSKLSNIEHPERIREKQEVKTQLSIPAKEEEKPKRDRKRKEK